MANGKWISDISAQTPLVDAARRVLNLRLQVVHRYLPLALEEWTKDPEHVHQLRVGTRRAGAALNIFESCLPSQIHKKLAKGLRKLRRAAGAARDWDVFAQALNQREARAKDAHRPGLDFLIGFALGQRFAAQEALAVASPELPQDFESLVVEGLANLRQPYGDGAAGAFGNLARPRLTCLLQHLESAASGDLEKYEQLHQVRIVGKHLRYSMEIFAGCFGADFKERYYPMVEEMQEILGLANDSHVAGQRLTTLRDFLKRGDAGQWKRFKPGVESLLRYHQSRLLQKRRKFLHWWERWHKAGDSKALTAMVSVTA
jgi:CHAD domain-containing protein